MALIAVAADKGAPGVTTTAVALAAVWPRPVLLAECDPAGGDLVYWLPAADGSRLDPRRGLLSLAVAARRGLQPHQMWEHAQKLHGGLDVLVGVTSAEQAVGLQLLWGSVGRVLAGIPQADVIVDCGRLGVDGPHYDMLAQATSIVLITRANLGDVIRLRDRVNVVADALQKRGRPGTRVDVVVVADYRHFKTAIAEVAHALGQSKAPARIIGGLAHEPRSAEQLRGEWGGKLDKSMLIRTARGIASHIAAGLPVFPAGAAQVQGTHGQAAVARPAQDRPDAAYPQSPPRPGQQEGSPGARELRQSQSQPPARSAQVSTRYPATPSPQVQPPATTPGQPRPSAQPNGTQAGSPPRPPRPPDGQPLRGRHAGPPVAPATDPDRPDAERKAQPRPLPAPLPAPPATPSPPPRGPRGG